MSLPSSYTNTIQFTENEDIDLQNKFVGFEEELHKNEIVKKITISQTFVEFEIHSLFNIEYFVEISINQDNLNNINYEIKLNKLIQVCIALVIFIAFFSSFGFAGFLWFSAIITTIFYAINIVVVDKKIREMIQIVVKGNKNSDNTEETLSDEQKAWIRDHSKCPACGENITDYDRNCPECGLKLRDKTAPKPYDVSKYEKKRVKYYFREKKKG